MKVAAVVFNSVLHDTRVIKEAESLKKNGFEVKIFGVFDNKYTSQLHKTPAGVPVELVEWRHLVKKKSEKQINSGKKQIFKNGVDILILGVLLFFSSYVSQTRYAVELLYLIVSVTIYSFYIYFIYKNEFRQFVDKTSRLFIDNTSQRVWAQRNEIKLKIREFLDKFDFLSNVIRFFYLQKRFAMFSDAIIEQLKDFNPDIVHCHDLHALPVGLGMKKMSPVKLVYDSHEIYTELSNNSWIKKRYYKKFEKKSSAYVDAFITVNDSIADLLKTENPLLPTPVVVKNATKFNGEKTIYDGRLHDAADLNRDKKIFLYQGGYAKHRGLTHLVRASVLLPEKWCVVFMGWGTLEDELKALALELDPKGHKIRFIPPAPHKELVFWTTGATLGVIPYENVSLNHYYCSPNKLWEYPNAGVPLLVSPFPEMVKIVKAYKNGWLLSDPITPEGIASVVNSISDEELQAAKKNSVKFVRQDNWNIYQQRLLEMYKSIDY